MILLLSDDTWAKLVKVLHDSEDGLEIVRELSTPPVLPEDREALGETAIDLLQSIFRHKDEPDWRDRDPD
jgi:hypothetical protein